MAQLFEQRMEKDGLLELFRRLEMPLLPVLAGMEQSGVVSTPRPSGPSSTMCRAGWTSSRPMSTSWRARSSTSVRPSSWAMCCSTGWACPRRARPREARLPPASRRWKNWPGSIRWWTASCSTASWRRCAPPISIPCRAWWTRRAASIPLSTRRPRLRDGSPPAIPTCRTSPCAGRWASACAPASSPGRAACWSRPTIRRWSCACWPMSRRIRHCWKPSATARTSTPARRPWSMTCRPTR